MPWWWPFSLSKMERIDCPDGHVAMVYKDINDALPLGLRDIDRQATANAAVETLGQGEAAAQYRSAVSRIMFAINERNSSQVLDFRNAYLTYMADPCGKGDFLERAQNKIIDQRGFLDRMQIRAQMLVELIKHSPDRADLIIPQCHHIMSEMGLPAPELAVGAIEQAREDAKEMLEGPPDA